MLLEVGSIHRSRFMSSLGSSLHFNVVLSGSKDARDDLSYFVRFFLGEAGSFSALSFLSRAISSSVSSPTTPPALPPPRNSLLSFIAAALASTNAGSVSGSVSELSSLELELDDELVFSRRSPPRAAVERQPPPRDPGAPFAAS